MSSPTVRHEAAIGPRPMADAGLRAAIRETLPEAAHQRCHAHFLRNALDRLPRKADDDCLQKLRWLYDRRDLAEAGTDLAAWLAKREARYPRLAAWAEEAIEETLTFHRLPRRHHKHLESANMLERLDEEIKRRTHVVRIPYAIALADRLQRLRSSAVAAWAARTPSKFGSRAPDGRVRGNPQRQPQRYRELYRALRHEPAPHRHWE